MSLCGDLKCQVALAERFAAAQERERKEHKETTGNAEELEFRSYLVQMGIASPVTKYVPSLSLSPDFNCIFVRQTAGSLYHTELSRQLSDWLIQGRLGKGITTSMIPLTDLYCYVNRARGSGIRERSDSRLFFPNRIDIS